MCDGRDTQALPAGKKSELYALSGSEDTKKLCNFP